MAEHPSETVIQGADGDRQYASQFMTNGLSAIFALAIVVVMAHSFGISFSHFG